MIPYSSMGTERGINSREMAVTAFEKNRIEKVTLAPDNIVLMLSNGVIIVVPTPFNCQPTCYVPQR